MTRGSATRSNYFEVKDRQAFETWLENFNYEDPPEIWEKEKDNNNLIAFGMYDSIPSSRDLPAIFNDDDLQYPYEDVDPDQFYEELAEHLAPNQVVIIESVSFDKLRSLTGSARAIHSDGRVLEVYFGQLDKLVKKEWGVTPTPAQY